MPPPWLSVPTRVSSPQHRTTNGQENPLRLATIGPFACSCRDQYHFREWARDGVPTQDPGSGSPAAGIDPDNTF